ncbi:unnamed protein product, partial [Meganyctiphanes norvegica]
AKFWIWVLKTKISIQFTSIVFLNSVKISVALFCTVTGPISCWSVSLDSGPCCCRYKKFWWLWCEVCLTGPRCTAGGGDGWRYCWGRRLVRPVGLQCLVASFTIPRVPAQPLVERRGMLRS